MSDVAPVPTTPPAPIWSCEFFALKEDNGPALDALTVGAKFGWKCHGDLAVAWNEHEIPKVVFAKPEDQYKLVILKVVRQDPNDVQYVVTAYKPGDHAPEYARVMQGQGPGPGPGAASGPGGTAAKGFEVTAPKWTVKSVLDPKQKPPPQPYPSFGPWNLDLPLWFIITIGLVLLVLAVAVYRRVRKYNQRRRMLEELKRHRTAMPPLFQFYRDARQLRRRLHNIKDPSELNDIAADLDREFRLYVLREFQIPALDWSTPDILRELKRRHRKTYRAAADPLKRTLRELTKLKARSQLEVQDVEQMQRMSLDAAERLQNAGGRA